MAGVRRKEVAEGVFDLLYIEIVDSFLKMNPHGPMDDITLAKLEGMGFSTGQRLVERYTRDRPRFTDQLEVVKFLCKEFWMEVFKKQMDNLRTNHRGTYHLFDDKFRWLTRIANKEAGAHYLLFPCGLIRGALANLGFVASVSADITTLPRCFFTIKINSS